MKEFLINWIWQLPQNICGILWKSFKKDSIIAKVGSPESDKLGAIIYLMKAGGGVTLGKHIFISQTYTDCTKVIIHECGHVKQSRILGPLYLLVIGIPSILHAWLNGYIGCCRNSGYGHFFTEKWADNLMKK